MKKLIGIFVCMLLIITMIPMVGTAEYVKYKVCNVMINEPYEIKTIDYIDNGETLDQSQLETIGLVIGICPFQWIAQGFKPTVMTLTRVELYLFRDGSPPEDTIFTVSIRDSLNGSDLTSTEVVSGYITPNPKWVEFDFPDIQVIPEQTYYIVARSDNCSETGWHGWTATTYNPYDRGDAWIGDDEYGYWEKIDWPEIPECDMTFKTYGINEDPNIPNIEGPTDGIVNTEYNYNITTTDYEGYDVWYYIKWGDGSIDEWIGPYTSGENITVDHSWNKKKTYEVSVKAKDMHDFESDWATLEVTIPKSQCYQWWMVWLDRFPILQKLLGVLSRIYI